MKSQSKKTLNQPIFIHDDNKFLLEDLCDAFQHLLGDQGLVKELLHEINVPKHSHVVFDVGIGEGELYELLKKFAPINIWLISGKNLSSIENFRQQFDKKHPQYKKCLRRAIFQKPLDETRLLAEIYEREQKKKPAGSTPSKYPSDEIKVHMNLHRPARLIDAVGRVLSVNKFWVEGTSVYRPDLPDKYSEWVIRLRKKHDGFLREKQWLSADDAETIYTRGYFEIHSYAMNDTPHVVQFIIPNDRTTSWQPIFSEDDLVELCKPVMEVLVNRLFTRARLYRVLRYPDRGFYKKALYSEGDNIEIFNGMHKGCADLERRIVKYDQSSSIEGSNLTQRIVNVKETDRYWDKKVGMEDVPNWLEVPILVPSKHRNLKTVALLIFDRKPDGRIWDYESEIREEEIEKEEKLLLDSVEEIGRLFQVRQKQEYYESSENVSNWLHTIQPDQRADHLAINAFRTLLGNEKFKTDDAALIRLRGIEAVMIENRKSIETSEPIDNPEKYNLTPITRFTKTRCLYPSSEIPEGIEGNLENWNKNDYRMLIPTRSGGKVWYIFCFSRKASNDLSTKCTQCWYRHDKNLAQDLVVALGEYLSEQYAVQLTANSVERIFIHEAITLFSSMRNAFPPQHEEGVEFQPLLRGIKRLQYFLDNMRLVRKLSIKNRDSKVSKSIVQQSIYNVVSSIIDSTEIRNLKISGLETINYFDLSVDKFLFELVVYNLLNNAARYAPKNTTITFRSTYDDIYWRVFISNSLNKLLSKKQVRTLFDEYTSYSRSNRNKGIGLGLANSRSTAIEFGGDLKVKQDAKNKIITFELILPIFSEKRG